ncbi:MAG: DEAD/DEAH box helicase [Methanomassiliicoccales archaeon]|jgi:helicase
MRVEELELPRGVVEVLRRDGIEELYPPQAAALPSALAGKNLVIAIPTASGKSLIAYMAALKHIMESSGKVLYIVPLRALASEKFEDLKKFEELGVRVDISVGDFDTPDPHLESFDIIVATSEKADSLLRHRSKWLESISLVVADEVHLIHDPERGPTLEITLAKFRKYNPDLQVIALSATIKNSKELASWLEAEHISSEWRPVPLKEGVFLDGAIRFTDNTTRKVEETGDAVWSLIRDSLIEGGQCLVFVNTRKSTESLAMTYAPLMKDFVKEGRQLEKDAERILEEEAEPTSVGKKLRTCIKRGIAFHNAGLTNEQRRLVENAFKKGDIKCIIATPTLAAGINLPARRVIVRDVYRYEANIGHMTIPVLEIKQMCGRAGRPRYDKFGEAVLVAKSEEEKQFLMENYLLSETEEIFSKLGSEPVLRSHVLATIATGTANSKESLMDFFDSTFFAHQTSTIGLEGATDCVLDFLEKEGMVSSNGGLRATFFGKRVSDLYIDPLSAVRLRDALNAFKEESSSFGLLHAVCSTPDMLNMYLRRGEYEIMEEIFMQRSGELLLPTPEDLTEYEFFLSELKTACALEEWIGEHEEDDILKTYNMGPGDLKNKVEVGEWLLYSMREVSNIFNKNAYPMLTDLMTRVRYGVRKELLDLVRLKGVGRVRARVLFDHGFKTLNDIKAAEVIALARLPRIGEVLAKNIKAQVGDSSTQIGKWEEEAEGTEEIDNGQRRLTDF